MHLYGKSSLLFGFTITFLLTACGGGGDTAPTNPGSGIGDPTNILSFGALDAGPEVSGSDLELFYQSNRAGGLGGLDIYVSTRTATSNNWGNGSNIGDTINSTADDGGASITADGLTLFFASNREGGQGLFDLYTSSRATIGDTWGAAANLGVIINTQYGEGGPSISSDGLSLYYHSSRPGLGLSDVYVSTRATAQDPWGPPAILSTSVNSSMVEAAPEISSDGLTLYFHSNRSGGVGSLDIWKVVRNSIGDAWSTSNVLPAPINSTSIETGVSVSSGGDTLYFSSNRTGSNIRDIWQVDL